VVFRVLTVAALVAIILSASNRTNPAHAGTAAGLDPLLSQALTTAAPTQPLTVIAELSGPPSALTLAAVRTLGAAVVPFRSLPMMAVLGTPSQILAVAGLAGVTSLWLNHPVELALHESVHQIGADQVHAAPYNITGAGVGVAILDSGIDGNHPDLAYPQHTIQNVKILGETRLFTSPTPPTLAVENVIDTDTTAGHGTHVAGIVAGDGTASSGYYVGVAPGANLIGVGSGDAEDMLTTLAGYDWILQNRSKYNIRVINASWADDTDPYSANDPLNQASLAAYNAGITVVVAAGNDGPGTSNVNTSPAGYNIYAWPSWVVGVAAEDKTGAWANYSSVGDSVHHPDITAPGSYIASARAITGVVTDTNSTPFDLTDPSNPRVVSGANNVYYTVALGTSMATPHVTGTVALMLQANPTLSPAQIKADLLASAKPMAGCPVTACGAGGLDALGGVRLALAQVAQPPVAALTATPTSGAAPLHVTLDASASYNPSGGQVASYEWDFEGSGSVDLVTSAPTATHDYEPGTYHPTVVAVDADGLSSSPAAGPVISSANPPHAQASVPSRGRSGQAVAFDASGSTQPAPGAIASYQFTFGDGTSVTSSTPVVSHTYTAAHPTLFGWSLVVTNNAGVTDGVGGTIKVTP
jgi:serine protease AprX